MSFKSGAGKVFFTSFHNSAQATSDMVEILKYLVFNIQQSNNEDNLIDLSLVNGYSYKGSVFGNLKSNETSEMYSYAPKSGYDFMIVSDTSLGDFSMKLIDPDGNEYSNKTVGIQSNTNRTYSSQSSNNMEVLSMGIEGFRVTNPIDGTWKYAITSNGIPNDENVFVIGIAEKPQMPVVMDADLLSFLNSGENVKINGIASVNGKLLVTLINNLDQSIIFSNDIESDYQQTFDFDIPKLDDGRYSLLLQSEDVEGNKSWILNISINVDSIAPIIQINEAYERTYYDDSLTFLGSATNAALVDIEVNGTPVPVETVSTSQKVIPVIAFSANLSLNNGPNNIVIKATSTNGLIATKSIIINSDTSTPEIQKSKPIIESISLEPETEISARTDVIVNVENGDKDNTILNVFINNQSIETINNGNGQYQFSIEPDDFYTGNLDISIEAVNKWGYFDYKSIVAHLIQGKTPNISVIHPDDIEAYVNECISVNLDDVFISNNSTALTFESNIGFIEDNVWFFEATDVGNYPISLTAISQTDEESTAFNVTVELERKMDFESNLALAPIAGSGKISATATVSNNTNTSTNITIIVALYDESGKMIGSKVDTASIASGETKDFIANIDYGNAINAKAFLWKGESMIPICPAVTYVFPLER